MMTPWHERTILPKLATKDRKYVINSMNAKLEIYKH